MKALCLILLAYLFFSINCFSQKVTYKDLIGTCWNTRFPDSHDPNFPIEFIDSLRYTHLSDTLNYKLDTSFPTTLLHIYGINHKLIVDGILYDYRTVNDSELIKIVGKDTLKVQWNFDNGIKWNDNETFQNYSYLF